MKTRANSATLYWTELLEIITFQMHIFKAYTVPAFRQKFTMKALQEIRKLWQALKGGQIFSPKNKGKKNYFFLIYIFMHQACYGFCPNIEKKMGKKYNGKQNTGTKGGEEHLWAVLRISKSLSSYLFQTDFFFYLSRRNKVYKLFWRRQQKIIQSKLVTKWGRGIL